MKKNIFLFLIITLSLKLQAQETNPLSEAAFEELRKEVAGESYDAKRLIKAKELSDAQFLYVSQIKTLMESMSLENNKLDFAKYAYATTLDAENYGALETMFRMEDSKKELKDYISKREPPIITKKDKIENNKNISGTDTRITTNSSSTTTTTNTVIQTSGPSAMTDQAFAIAKRQVSEESFESSKLRRAKQMSDANYMLSSQVKEIAEVLSFESSRLEYAKYAYSKTYDPGNYDLVNMALLHSRSKEELTTFVKKEKVVDYSLKAKEEQAIANEKTAKENADAAFDILSNQDFVSAKKQISAQSSDAKKLEVAKKIADEKDLTAVQVKEILELLLFEANRVEYAKYAYSRTKDKENFNIVKDLLTKENHLVLEDYIKTVGTTAVGTGPSELSPEDFAVLVQEINSSALESYKLNKAKVIVDRTYFSSEQVRQINNLFSMEEAKLDFAKYAYGRTLDKDKYSIVREGLTKSTSKYTLDKYIKEYQ